MGRGGVEACIFLHDKSMSGVILETAMGKFASRFFSERLHLIFLFALHKPVTLKFKMTY